MPRARCHERMRPRGTRLRVQLARDDLAGHVLGQRGRCLRTWRDAWQATSCLRCYGSATVARQGTLRASQRWIARDTGRSARRARDVWHASWACLVVGSAGEEAMFAKLQDHSDVAVRERAARVRSHWLSPAAWKDFPPHPGGQVNLRRISSGPLTAAEVQAVLAPLPDRLRRCAQSTRATRGGRGPPASTSTSRCSANGRARTRGPGERPTRRLHRRTSAPGCPARRQCGEPGCASR
jgi:hypothetical protein